MEIVHRNKCEIKLNSRETALNTLPFNMYSQQICYFLNFYPRMHKTQFLFISRHLKISHYDMYTLTHVCNTHTNCRGMKEFQTEKKHKFHNFTNTHKNFKERKNYSHAILLIRFVVILSVLLLTRCMKTFSIFVRDEGINCCVFMSFSCFIKASSEFLFISYLGRN